MAAEILGRCGAPHRIEISRRSNHHPVQILRQASCDHSLRNRAAIADAGIEPTRDHVNEVIGDLDLDLNVRVSSSEGRQQRSEQQACRVAQHVDADTPGWALTELIQAIQRLVDSSKRWIEVLEKRLAGRGEPDAAAGAVEQPHTNPGFQATHGMAQRRRGDAPNGRGAPEATMANDVEEGVEIGQIGAAGHPASLSSAHPSVKQLTTASEAEARYKSKPDLPRHSLTGCDYPTSGPVPQHTPLVRITGPASEFVDRTPTGNTYDQSAPYILQ
jgi:hypothetical protein